MSDRELRYWPNGTVAHTVRPNYFNGTIWVADCGYAGENSEWRGTGSQEEYEKAASLPLCRRCTLAQERAIVDKEKADRIRAEFEAFAENRRRDKLRKKSR